MEAIDRLRQIKTTADYAEARKLSLFGRLSTRSGNVIWKLLHRYGKEPEELMTYSYKLFRQVKNCGRTTASEILTWLHGDDEWPPDEVYRTGYTHELPQWPRPIPVSERLPESGELVLAFCKFEMAGNYGKEGWFHSEYGKSMGFGFGDERVRCGNRTITHWLPLPPKPEFTIIDRSRVKEVERSRFEIGPDVLIVDGTHWHHPLGVPEMSPADYPCCEAHERIERIPGDATTLVGGRCPIHGETIYRPKPDVTPA